MLKWGFRANIKVHGADESKSAKLGLKNPTNTESKRALSKFVSKELPIIDASKKLWLNPLLFNGSLQTLWYTSHDSSNKFLVYYGREIFDYSDGGICSLDWVIPTPKSSAEFKKLAEETMVEGSPRLNARSRFFSNEELEQRSQGDAHSTTPIMVVLHGLGGGSHEPLIRNLAEKIKTDDKTGDWDVVVINSRGCCRTKITTEKVFNAFSTDDIKEVLIEINRRFPHRPIYTVGFSFGAALLANFLGSQDREATRLVKASVLIGCPWDLLDSAYHIDDSWTGYYLFNPALVKYLHKIIKNNYKELHGHDPVLFNEENLVASRKHSKTWQFDSMYTAKTAGFTNAFDYYRESSPVRRLRFIDVPTLAVNSTDDPAVSCRIPWMEAQQNPYVNVVETDLGGHLGYVQWSGEFWCAQVAHDYFSAFEKTFE